MCSLVPSLTLYGTTQITSTTSGLITSFSTYSAAPTLSSTIQYYSRCDSTGGNCVARSTTNMIAATPIMTSTIVTFGEKETVVTSIVPQQTLYYPCLSTAGIKPEVTTESAPAPPVQSMSDEISQGFSPPSSFIGAFTPTIASSTVTPMIIPSSTTIPISSESTSISISIASSSIGTKSPSASTTSKDTLATSLSTSTSRIGDLSPPDSSSSSISSDIDPSSSSSDTSPPPVHISHKTAIIASIASVLVALFILCMVAICWKRRTAEHEDQYESEGQGVEDDYWERRFKALEAGSAGTGEKYLSGNQDGEDDVRKLRLTLDLGSKSLTSRPASRLSTISAFFSKAAQPAPFMRRNADKPAPNFSRPRFGRRVTSFQTKNRNVKSREEEDADEERRGTDLRRSGVERGGRGMEWIKGIEENGLGGKEVVAEENGRYPSPRALRRISDETFGYAREIGTGGLAGSPLRQNHLKSARSPLRSAISDRKSGSGASSRTGQRSSQLRSGDVLAVPSVHRTSDDTSRSSSDENGPADQTSPISTSAVSTISSDRSTSASRPYTQPPPPDPTRNLYPAQPRPSLRCRKESKGKTIAPLKLSREAITPSLWIDDELYDQFQAGQREDQGDKLEISQYSLDSSAGGTARGSVQRGGEDVYGGLASGVSGNAVDRMNEGDDGSSGVSRYSKGLSDGLEGDERSAVTPRLPDVDISSSPKGGDDWGLGEFGVGNIDTR